MVDAFRAVGGKRPDFNSYLNHFEKSVIQDQEMNKKVMKEYLEIVK